MGFLVDKVAVGRAPRVFTSNTTKWPKIRAGQVNIVDLSSLCREKVSVCHHNYQCQEIIEREVH